VCMFVCVCVHVCVCVCACLCVCVCVCVCLDVQVASQCQLCIGGCVYAFGVCVHVCVYVFVCVCVPSHNYLTKMKCVTSHSYLAKISRTVLQALDLQDSFVTAQVDFCTSHSSLLYSLLHVEHDFRADL